MQPAWQELVALWIISGTGTHLHVGIYISMQVIFCQPRYKHQRLTSRHSCSLQGLHVIVL